MRSPPVRNQVTPGTAAAIFQRVTGVLLAPPAAISSDAPGLVGLAPAAAKILWTGFSSSDPHDPPEIQHSTANWLGQAASLAVYSRPVAFFGVAHWRSVYFIICDLSPLLASTGPFSPRGLIAGSHLPHSLPLGSLCLPLPPDWPLPPFPCRCLPHRLSPLAFFGSWLAGGLAGWLAGWRAGGWVGGWLVAGSLAGN